jgi:hypothetical protein
LHPHTHFLFSLSNETAAPSAACFSGTAGSTGGFGVFLAGLPRFFFNFSVFSASFLHGFSRAGIAPETKFPLNQTARFVYSEIILCKDLFINKMNKS